MEVSIFYFVSKAKTTLHNCIKKHVILACLVLNVHYVQNL